MSDILCVTDRRLCSGDFLSRIRAIAASRPRGIILREKDLPEAEYQSLAFQVLSICAEFGTPCILHGFYKAAAALKAPAIHLPLEALRAMSAGQKSAFSAIGASCHSLEDALEAQRLGCTCITAGHIFETACKQGLPGRGLPFLREICAAVSLPVYGIGGVNAGNVNLIRDAGAAGACVMSGVMQCADPSSHLRKLAAPALSAPRPCAVFDMDGTLIDSMKYWRRLGKEYLTAKGVTGDLTETLAEIAPMTLSQSAELFVRRFPLGCTPEAAAAEMNHMMEEHYRRDIPLKGRVLPLLHRLKGMGVRLCVASATAEPLMADCLKRLGIFSMFDFILSCETLGTSKREPLIYLEAARRFGVPTQDISVYEDALYAVETAKKAGFHVVAVYDEEEDSHWSQICRLSDAAANLT